jgi:hypothetical protein
MTYEALHKLAKRGTVPQIGQGAIGRALAIERETALNEAEPADLMDF